MGRLLDFLIEPLHLVVFGVAMFFVFFAMGRRSKLR